MKVKDENDKLLEGTLPTDAFADTEPYDPDAPPTRKPAKDLLANIWHRLEPTSLDARPPDREWLLTRAIGEPRTGGRQVGAVPLGKVGFLVAEGGAGKTASLVHLAACVASGDTTRSATAWEQGDFGHAWLGLFRADRPGRVLLALGEEDLSEVTRRFYAAVRALNLSAEERARLVERVDLLALAGHEALFVSCDHRGNSAETPFVEQLRERMERTTKERGPYRLVALDPLARFAGSDAERDNASATRFIETTESLASARFGSPAVLVAHHTPKASRGAKATAEVSSRGVSGLTDGARLAITLKAGEDWGEKKIYSIEIVKSNYGPTMPETLFARSYSDEDGLMWKPLSDTEAKAYKQSLAERLVEHKEETRELVERVKEKRTAARSATKPPQSLLDDE